MMIKVKDLFHVKYGSQLDLNKQLIVYDSSGVNFVNRSAVKLGITCVVKKVDKVVPFDKGLITVALGGSTLSAYVQPKEFYTGQNVKILEPRQKLSYRKKIFYCLCIKHNAYKYSAFGREANRTLGNILIPSLEEIPSWVDKVAWPHQPTKEPQHYKQVSLQDRKWRWFNLKDIFVINKGERIIKNNRIKGNMPLITANSVNNGIAENLDYNAFKNEKKVFERKITVDMFFNTFYHTYKYFSDDNVHTLIPNVPLNTFMALFLVTSIKMNQYKYAYGRQLRLNKLKKEKIKLPITQDGKPDWAFMEDYIKSLPYSGNLKEERLTP